jgi:2-dehydropantoate 2-reductase
MKIAVFGAGAVGGHIAAKLASRGHDVSVVGRGAHFEAMREKGVTLIHGAETIRGRVRTADPGVQDFVFVTLKANALSAFAAQGAALVGAHTGVVFAQNGIPWWYAIGLGADRPKPPPMTRLDPGIKFLSEKQIIGCVVYSANEVREPGVIVNNVPGNNMLVVGHADDRDSSEIRALRALLGEADLHSPPADDIRAAVWGKLVQNLSTATLCTLTGASVKEVREDARLSEIAKRLAQEGRAIAKAHRVDPDRAPQRPSGGQSSGAISHKPSLLQDYERGRPMEIDALLVAVLDFARAAHVAAPTLETVVPLVVHKAAAKGLYED